MLPEPNCTDGVDDFPVDRGETDCVVGEGSAGVVGVGPVALGGGRKNWLMLLLSSYPRNQVSPLTTPLGALHQALGPAEGYRLGRQIRDVPPISLSCLGLISFP